MAADIIALPGARDVSPASIVVCCYSDERWQDLQEAILSALAQSPPAREVVVVVDHNPALAGRVAARFASSFPLLSVVENGGPRGLSGARNAGIAASTGAMILFLDDDAVAAPNLLARLTARVAEPGTLGAMAAIRPDWTGGRPGWFPDAFLWTVGCTYEGLAAGEVRNLIGAAMCVRRSVFERVGGFTTDLGRTHAALPLGCEETELCIRAGRDGRFVHEPAALCQHKVPPRRATWRYFLHRCWAEGLSKAALSAIAGTGRSLAAERTYVARTLPRAVRGALADFVLRGEASGGPRAAAILSGLAVTAAGYAAGRARLAAGGRRGPSAPSTRRPAGSVG